MYGCPGKTSPPVSSVALCSSDFGYLYHKLILLFRFLFPSLYGDEMLFLEGMFGLMEFGRGMIAGTPQPWVSKIAARPGHKTGRRDGYTLLERHPSAKYPFITTSWIGKVSQTTIDP